MTYESPSVREHLVKTFISKMYNLVDSFQYELRFSNHKGALVVAQQIIHLLKTDEFKRFNIHPLEIVDSDKYLYLAYFAAKAIIELSKDK